MLSRVRHKKIRRKIEKGSAWKLVYKKFEPNDESLREALCTLGNGYFGTRGAATESIASKVHYPGTYISGVYNKTPTHIAGRTIFNDDMVNCPNWLFLTFRIGKEHWLVPSASNILCYHKELDMRNGALNRKVSLQDRKDRKTTIETERIVHMVDPHRAAIKYSIVPENYEGWITIRSALDGTLQNTGVARYRKLNSKHLKTNFSGMLKKNISYLSMKTSHSKIDICQAARVRIFSQGKELKPPVMILAKKKKAIYQEFKIYIHKRRRYEIEKIVAIYTSRDKGVRNALKSAIVSAKEAPTFAALLKTHKEAWHKLWDRFDIQIEGDIFSQKVLRLHTFHLLQTASPHNVDIDAGLPARGLHGEAYRGHVFWDRIYVTPFFDLHYPEISRALFMYRYRRLDQARKYAREHGYKGAMFPWQSASSGEEETQVIHLNPVSNKWGPDYSSIQRHISFDIAYDIWEYWNRTGDFDFFLRYGAEIILSIAQFGSSLVSYDEKDKRYHTYGIMGPDEFHERLPKAKKPGLKDNAYTNVLIAWILFRAQEIMQILPPTYKKRILKKARLSQKEIASWEDIARKIKIIITREGIISQFAGYFKLKELNWQAYSAKYGKIQRIDRILKAEGKSPDDYKVAKQADVLMMFYLFSLQEVESLLHKMGYGFTKNMLKKNFKYYIKRTSHGSTLSKVVHCYITHLLGRSREAWHWFVEVLRSDIYDTQGGTTPEGVHIGVMGGSIDIVLRAFAGLEMTSKGLSIDPDLPKHWRNIRLKFCYRKKLVSLSITRRQLVVSMIKSKSKTFKLPVEIRGRLHYLHSEKKYKINI
ncbi:MAG: glycoside hydrolase family 65 protein [Candidatus Omnitrophica bacterium]|nr:glycoside hydrolase family 65 protein [Candidatus Omnitrophota bacterium]